MWHELRQICTYIGTNTWALVGLSQIWGEFGFLADRGVDRYSLVAHDWGAAALALAQAEPGRVERLVLMDAVPLLPGYEWHALARWWRRPLAGEMAMGFTFKWVTRRLLRQADGSDFPASELDDIWDHFDHGTQRAILKLYRSAVHIGKEWQPDLEQQQVPAMVVWGREDPYVPLHFGERLAERMRAELVVLECGHWWPFEKPGETAEALLRHWAKVAA